MNTLIRTLPCRRALAALIAIFALAACSDNGDELSPALVSKGKDIFRFETFGDETFWTDTLRMHEVIQSRRRSDDRARPSASRSTPTRFPPRWSQGIQDGSDQPDQSRDDGRAAQAQRSRRPEGHGRDRRTARTR